MKTLAYYCNLLPTHRDPLVTVPSPFQHRTGRMFFDLPVDGMEVTLATRIYHHCSYRSLADGTAKAAVPDCHGKLIRGITEMLRKIIIDRSASDHRTAGDKKILIKGNTKSLRGRTTRILKTNEKILPRKKDRRSRESPVPCTRPIRHIQYRLTRTHIQTILIILPCLQVFHHMPVL